MEKARGDYLLAMRLQQNDPLLVDHFNFSKCLHAFLLCSHVKSKSRAKTWS